MITVDDLVWGALNIGLASSLNDALDLTILQIMWGVERAIGKKKDAAKGPTRKVTPAELRKIREAKRGR